MLIFRIQRHYSKTATISDNCRLKILTTIRQLTKSVLKRDFDLKLELPDDRLCPPVPVRYHYVRWLQELMDSTSDTTSEDPPKDEIIGLDM
jgi:23S rRNA (adenine1618-N6)-methyltransferase